MWARRGAAPGAHGAAGLGGRARGRARRASGRWAAAVAAAAMGGTLVAACGSGGHPSTAVDAMKQWVAQLSTNYDAQWATMVPAQQTAIPKATYALCNEEQYAGSNIGNSPPAAIYLDTVSVTQANEVPPGATAALPATLVTSKIEIGKAIRTVTLTWFELPDGWRWAMSNEAAAAYRKTSCPSVVSGSLPYKPTTTTTTTTAPTTTVPLVPASNIRVQALNGLRVGPLSSEAIVKLKSLGYVTGYPDNTTAPVTASAIYVLTAGFVPEAQALAKSLGLPASAVVPAVPPPPTAPIPNYALGHFDLVLVIGPDLAPKLNAGG